MARNVLILLVAFVFISSASRTPEVTEKYIERFKELAVLDMHQTGIPASIKLGQAIMESQAGTSELAINANNHFGIKCKREWGGNTFYKTDDDFDREGNLIKSCFRAYPSAVQSFEDHSEFLLTRGRYAPLFELESTDYKGWAYGLSTCGYATDPNYAKKLIRIIEKYGLHELDSSGLSLPVRNQETTENSKASPSKEMEQYFQNKKRSVKI